MCTKVHVNKFKYLLLVDLALFKYSNFTTDHVSWTVLSFKIMVGYNRNGDRRMVESSFSRFPNKQGSILKQRIIEQIFTHRDVKRTGLNRIEEPLQNYTITSLRDWSPHQKMVRAHCHYFSYRPSLSPTFHRIDLVTRSLMHMETHACTVRRAWIALWKWFLISVGKCLEKFYHLLSGTQGIPGRRTLAANSTWEISVTWDVHHSAWVKLHCLPIIVLAVLEAVTFSVGAIAFWWDKSSGFGAHHSHLIAFG